MSTFDLNELLEAIQNARPKPDPADGAFTTQEFMEATGLSRERAYAAIRVALDREMLEAVRTPRVNLANATVRVYGWRVVAPPAGEQEAP